MVRVALTDASYALCTVSQQASFSIARAPATPPACCSGAFWISVGVYGVIRTAGVAGWGLGWQRSATHRHQSLLASGLLILWPASTHIPPKLHCPPFPPAGIFFLDAPKGQEALTALFGVASIGFMVRWGPHGWGGIPCACVPHSSCSPPFHRRACCLLTRPGRFHPFLPCRSCPPSSTWPCPS